MPFRNVVNCNVFEAELSEQGLGGELYQRFLINHNALIKSKTFYAKYVFLVQIVKLYLVVWGGNYYLNNPEKLQIHLDKNVALWVSSYSNLLRVIERF